MPGTRSDPHRRPLRHTHQEGPGFLLLATQGGRPPGPPVGEDLTGLRHRPRGQDRERVPAWVEQAVIVVHRLTYWHSKRLAAEFTRRGIHPVGHHAVDALLAEYGTSRPGVHRDRGEHRKVWIVGLVDDHSRLIIGLRILPSPSTQPILTWLADRLELRGMPHEVMSDNGSPFVVWMPGVSTLFGKTLAELEIERFWGVLQSELLDRELFATAEAAADGLTRFAGYYNYHRLHGELDWQTPAERWDGTPFTDRGFEHVPAIAHLQGWLTELMVA